MPEREFFKLSIEGLSSDVHVVKLHGHEGLSELYEFVVEFVSDDSSIVFDDVVGKPAVVEMMTNEDSRFVHGIVCRVEETGVGQKLTSYEVAIVPAFWAFGLKSDCCIYQELSVPDVIKDILESGGLASGTDFDLRLEGTYDSREYIVQYRESDLDFVRRLCEEAGIFFFFEHAEDGHKLVFADDPGAHADITGLVVLPFRSSETGMQSDVEQVSHLRFARTLRTGKVMMQSFNFEKNTLALAAESAAESASGHEAEHVEYDFDGRYGDENGGKALAQMRQQAYDARRRILTGSSNCRQFVAGFKFGVSEHPRDEINADYVLVRVRHEGEQPQAAGADAIGAESGRRAYTNTFEAIPATVPFRPLPLTERALIDGPQTAVVTGPSGEEIHCDAHARVKVRFHWDRYGPTDDKSSCWVRVSQSHRIADLAIPRVGEEVVVEFLEGDPDQPIITGRVYNGGNPSPYSLPGDKTKSTIRTPSSPGGGGFNEIRFEDAAGSEEIYLHAQKDWNIDVLHDRTQKIGHDNTHKVTANETMSVGGERSRTVGANETVTITKNRTLTVSGDESITVKGNETVEVQGGSTTHVVGITKLTVDKDFSLSVGKDVSHVVGGDESIAITGSQSATVDGDLTLATKANLTQSADGSFDTSAKGDASLAAKGKMSLDAGKKMLIEGADEITLKCGSASITLKKNGDIEIKGGKVNVKSDGNLTLKGSAIAQN